MWDFFDDALNWFDGSWVDQGLDWAGDLFSGADSLLDNAGGIVKAGKSIIEGASNVVGAAAPALESYFAAESIIFAAKQKQADYLAQAENYGFQAGIADLNGKIMAENLDYEVQMAYATEQMMDRQNRRDIGKMKATYGAAGVTMSGSAIDVLADSAAEGALNVAMLNYQSERRQQGIKYQMQANKLTADNYRKAAATAEANAATALKEGEKSKDLQDYITIGTSISAVPSIIEGVGDIIEVFTGDKK